MRDPRARFALAAVAVLAAAGCSSHEGLSAAPDRTVDVTMVDNAFEPTSVSVKTGETITFRFTNTGAVRHEGVIGDDAVQEEHRTDMATSSTEADDGHGDDGGHGGATSVTVEPGATGELTHTFDEGGTVLIGCHEPGHWEAGMRATIAVSG